MIPNRALLWTSPGQYRIVCAWERVCAVRRKKKGRPYFYDISVPDGPAPIVERCGPVLFEQDFDESKNTIRASLTYDLGIQV